MKNYSSNRAQKGHVGYRTPSRWKAGMPEQTKRMPPPSFPKHSNKASYYSGRNH